MNKKFNSNLNIDIIIKKNRRNFIKNFVKLSILFLFIFFFVFFIWEFVIRQKLIEKNFSNFPISVNNDLKISLEKAGKGFCLLNGNNLNFYDKDGSKINSLCCNLEKPKINCCKNFSIVYDQNGKVCNLNNFEINLCSVVLDDNILFAKVAENGNFAVVTGGEGVFCQLNVFDRDGNVIFKWSSTEKLITDFDFNKDGSGCFVCNLCTDENGFEKAVIYNFNFNKNKEVSKKILSGTMPLSLKVTNSGFGLVCNDAFYLFDNNCSLIKILKFSDDWTTFHLNYRNYFIFAFKNQLLIYDKFVNLLGKLNLNESIRKIKLIGKYVFVLVNDKLYVCNLRLKILKIIELNKLAEEFFCEGNYGYFLFANRVEKFKIF